MGSDYFPGRLKRQGPGDLRLNLRTLLWFADLYVTSPQGKENQHNWSLSSMDCLCMFSFCCSTST